MMAVKSFITPGSVLWLLLHIMLCCQSLYGQSYIADIQKLSVEDGLSSRFVNTIYQDSQGFMWIGTNFGLNRYDGYEFKLYTSENSPLSSNSIKDICEDKTQKLWIIHGKLYERYKLSDVDILDLQTGEIQSFDQAFKTVAPFTTGDIKHIYADTQKNIWIITRKNELYRYDNDRFKLFFHSPEKLNVILYVDNQYAWFLAKDLGKELIKVDMQGNIIKRFPAYGYADIMDSDKNNNFWIFQPKQKKLLQGNSNKESLRTIDLAPLKLHKKMYESHGTRKIYINNANDLIWWHQIYIPDIFLVIHPQKGIVSKMYDKIKPFLTFGEFQVFDIHPETENRTWIATNDGIFIISLKKNKFTTLLSGESEKYSIRAVIEDDHGNIYVSYYTGTTMIHSEKGTIKKDSSHVWLGATRDEQGHLWFSSQGNKIEKYTPLSKQSQYYTYPSGVKDKPLEQWAILRDKTGKVWTGTQKGLYSLEPETNLYQKFTQYNAFSQLRESGIYHLFEDEKGIWIAASSGLYLLEPGKGITARYAKEENTPFYIPYNHILHFHRDTAGIFWLATKGGGLIRFDPEDGNSQRFTTAEGLSSNIIYAVYEDDYGKLWLPGNYGLMQFDKKNFRVNTWLTGDGIAHNEFNTASHHQAADGKLYFGGLSGVTVFHPKNFITEDPVTAPLHITGCRVLDGKTGALTDKTITVSTSGKLVLSPSDKSFIIDFALLNYENTQNNSYAYTIEGLDKDWTAIRENSLRINALPYGRYVLRIKGQGIKGESAANELDITIVFNKPFYLKNWFIVSCIFILVLLTYGIFRWRLQSLKKAKTRLQETVKQRTAEIQKQRDKMEEDKNTVEKAKNIIEQQAEKLKELNATQSRWFTNIAHELRTPLTLILGPIRQFLKMHPGAAKTGIENIQLAEKNSMGLLKLVNEILDVSRLESNKLKLNKKPVNLTRLIRESTAHFDSFASQKGVSLTTHILYDFDLNIDKGRIQKILINLISNALKFTHSGGKVRVSAAHEAEKGVKISVADTGDGIPEKDLPHVFERYYQASHPRQINQGGAGIGLALSLELAKLHGGNLSAKSQPGKGSTFTLSLPQNLISSFKKPASGKTMTTPALLPDITVKSHTEMTNKQQNKPLVLLVEDNPDMRQYILSFMTRDYKIMEAADGLEALKYLEKTIPDLIISDIMMPRMDGISLAKALKADEHLKNIPFITLTAKTGESDKIATLRTGIDDYLTKPFNAEELEVRAANLIHNSRERRSTIEADPDEITAPSYQEKQLTEIKEFVMHRLDDNSLSVNDLAGAQNMSLSSLTRLLKKATGLNPSQFIREIRLQQARRLLEAKQYPTVLEVVYAVGFENPSHFTRRYTERFGKKPSEYL